MVRDMSDWDDFLNYINTLQNDGKRILFLVESGSALYGFKDENSDVDIRGVFIESLENILSVKRHKNKYDSSIGDIDYTMHELKKFGGLLYKGNFNIIEWIFSPHVYKLMSSIKKNDSKRLKDIAKGCVSVHTGNHVRGWAYSMYKMDWSKPKKSLYAIRPLMVYIYFCETQHIESNIVELSKEPTFSHMKEHVEGLIDLKLRGAEVPVEMIKRNKKYYNQLREKSLEIEKEVGLRTYPDDDIEERINKFMMDIRFERR